MQILGSLTLEQLIMSQPSQLILKDILAMRKISKLEDCWYKAGINMDSMSGHRGIMCHLPLTSPPPKFLVNCGIVAWVTLI
ncbi:hypothetical protein KY284_037323 [Solanum tuberosum]|nr:hypothetical protein KY284_037323 [Solanum tuberosum]